MGCLGSSKNGDTSLGSGEVLMDRSTSSGDDFFFFCRDTEEMSLLFCGEGCILLPFLTNWGLLRLVEWVSLDPLEWRRLLPMGLDNLWTGEPSANIVRSTLGRGGRVDEGYRSHTLCTVHYMYSGLFHKIVFTKHVILNSVLCF